MEEITYANDLIGSCHGVLALKSECGTGSMKITFLDGKLDDPAADSAPQVELLPDDVAAFPG